MITLIGEVYMYNKNKGSLQVLYKKRKCLCAFRNVFLNVNSSENVSFNRGGDSAAETP